MPRARVALVVLALLAVALWRPLVRPAAQATLLIADVFAPTLFGVPLAAWLTPAPRVTDTVERFGGTEMRVSWWRPGLGDRHDAVMVVNGASPYGNDNAATRALGVALARAGYLVMLPEFPFLKEGRLDPGAPAVVDAAFAHLRALPETRGSSVGAFGASVGGGVLLAAAGARPAVADATYLVVLGAYFDLDTFVASVVSTSQPRDGGVDAWTVDQEARDRVPAAVIDAAPPALREAVREAVRPGTYGEVLARLRALPREVREAHEALSPSASWGGVRAPVFWIHDPNDHFEPLAEAYAAQATPRAGKFALVVPRLVQHAEPGSVRGGGPLDTLSELWRLLAFTIEVLRTAG